MDSSALRRYRSPQPYQDNRQGLGGTSREMREKHAITERRLLRKWPRHRNEGERRRRGGERINATRYTEEGNPGNAFANQSSSPGARISSKEPFVFPSRPPVPRASLPPPISFFSSSFSAFVWSSTRGGTHVPHFLFPSPGPCNPIVGVESRLAGKGEMEKGEKRGNAGKSFEKRLRSLHGTILLAK